MGVLNRTPDSFSDGGLFLDEHHALEHASRMMERGACVIDVGAESTRPRAPKIAAAEQITRLGNVVCKLARKEILVSVDTTSPEVAAWAIEEGAAAINTVELEPAADLARVAAKGGAALILSHSRGAMAAMSDFSSASSTRYDDVVSDVARELSLARDRAVSAGLDVADIVLDPGLGFHKSAAESLALSVRLGELVALGSPVLAGPSRKSFLDVVTRTASSSLAPASPNDRLGATIAACLLCARNGAAMLRVHDVAEVAQALAFERAARNA